MSDQVSPEDLMHYFDGEASDELRERVYRKLGTCVDLQKEMGLLMTLRSELRILIPNLEQSQASIWKLVRDRLQKRGK
jgi:anti-sigma factor RsiW